jgi:hypothetical protein
LAETPVSEYTQFLQKIAANPSLTKAYAKLLKAANFYNGPITDKYTPALQQAFDSMEASRLSISKVRPIKRDDFINETISLGTGGGAGGTTTQRQRYIASPTQAAALLDTISEDLIGRKLSDSEKKKYMAILKAEQKKPESAQVTTTTSTGTGTSSSTTQGGLDEQQFLIQQIAGTDEAKANKVLNAYSTVLNMLGGLR